MKLGHGVIINAVQTIPSAKYVQFNLIWHGYGGSLVKTTVNENESRGRDSSGEKG